MKVWSVQVTLLGILLVCATQAQGGPLEDLLGGIDGPVTAKSLKTIQSFVPAEPAAKSASKVLEWMNGKAPARDLAGSLVLERIFQTKAPTGFDLNLFLPVLKRRNPDSIADMLPVVYLAASRMKASRASEVLMASLVGLAADQRPVIYRGADACLKVLSGESSIVSPAAWADWYSGKYGKGLSMRDHVIEVIAGVSAEGSSYRVNGDKVGDLDQLRKSLKALVESAQELQVPAYLVLDGSPGEPVIASALDLGKKFHFVQIEFRSVSGIRPPAITATLPFLRRRGVSYEKGGKCDVFLPKGKWNGAAVLWVVSDAWQSSSRLIEGGLSDWVSPLTRAGYVVCAVLPRTGPSQRMADMVADVRASIRFVRTDLALPGGHPKRIALLGHSAGGHLALLAAFECDPSTEVDAVAAFAAPSNLLGFADNSLTPVVEHLLAPPGASRDALIKAAAALSPIRHVSKGDPAVYLAHGKADAVVPSEQSRALAKELESAGVDTALTIVPKHGHVWNGAEKQWPALLQWLHKRLISEEK